MCDATTPESHYAAVLSDLRAKRDEIDQAIALLSRLAGGKSDQKPPDVAQPIVDQREHAGMFLGMSIPDATIKLLGIRKRTMGNAEICKELMAGGLALTGKDPANVISSVLTRRFNAVGDVVRVDRGTWGLKAWYPGRNFKKTKVPEELLEGVDLSDLGLGPTTDGVAAELGPDTVNPGDDP